MTAKELDWLFKLHDAFNFVCISVLVALDLLYLSKATDYSLIGTEHLGENDTDTILLIWNIFLAYLIIDCVWVVLAPHCAPAGAMSILIHHVVTIGYILIPKLIPQLRWHMGVAMLVEINTLLLTIRRNVPAKSIWYTVIDSLFLISWVLLRIIMYPIFTVFVFYEYRRYAVLTDQKWNLVLIAFFIQALLTGLGFKWSWDLLKKTLFKKKSA